MTSAKTLLMFAFIAFGTATFGYVIVPVLFPQLQGTPALWMWTTLWAVSLFVLFLALMYRIEHNARKH